MIPARTTPARHLLVAAALAATLVASLAVARSKTPGRHKADPAATPGHGDAATVEMVHITVQTVPSRKALVKWGRKNLGVIPAPKPLVFDRPRDSGPLDLVIRATGYLTVHTRAYTFSDSRLLVKLTPPAEKSKLFGYRKEANPDAGGPPDPNALGTAGSSAASTAPPLPSAP